MTRGHPRMISLVDGHLAGRLRRLDNPTGFDAVRADNHFSCLAVIHGTNILKVGIESPFIDVMRMADVVANQRFFTTNFANSRHDFFSFYLPPPGCHGPCKRLDAVS